MAHIEKRNRGGQTSWRARYRAPDGRERSRSFTKKSDAEQWLDTTRGDLAHGTYVDPAGGKKRFGEYAREWQAARVHRPTTAELVDSHLRDHLLPRFEDRPLGSIRRSEIQTFVKELSERLAPASVEVVYRFLASIFRSAVADRLIATTPCERIALPKLERKRAIPLETEQVLALADAVPDRYRALVVLAASTGLRQGEAFGLTVPNVDFLRRRLEVVQQRLLVLGRPPFLGPPKTDASIRTIPLPQVAIDALAEHLARYPAGKDQFVFTNEYGNPIRRTRFSDPWRRAVKAAGAPDGTGFHALRHYYASLLIVTASRSRSCNPGSGMRARPRRSTPTRTSGPTPRTARAKPSTPYCSMSRGPTAAHGPSRGAFPLATGLVVASRPVRRILSRVVPVMAIPLG